MAGTTSFRHRAVRGFTGGASVVLACALGFFVSGCGDSGSGGRMRDGTPVSGGGGVGAPPGGSGVGVGVAPPGGSGVGGAPPGGSGVGGAPGGGAPGSDGFDAGSAPDRNMVSAGEICERLATLQCAGEQHCCSDPGREFDACKSSAKEGCTENFHLDEIATDPITGFDEAGASAAFEELELRASTCDPQAAQWAVSTAGFITAFKGTRAEGQACTPTQPASVGQLFDPTSTDQLAALASCQDGANVVCMPALGQWTCTRRAEVNGACIFDGNCKDGLYCADSGFLMDACETRKTDGDDCTAANQCKSFICKGGKCAAPTAENAYCLAALE